MKILIHRILNLINVILFGKPQLINIHTLDALPYDPLYFAELEKVRKPLYYFSNEFCVNDSYIEMSFYQLTHSPQWTPQDVYQYVHEVRIKYNNLRLCKLHLN